MSHSQAESLASPPTAAVPPQPDILRGWIKTAKDALLVFEATRVGIVPRVTRRFHELEKRSIIQSGAILVFTEEESGIKRWTDPYLWSASRMQGNFLMYREREDEQAFEAGSPYRCSAMASPAPGAEPRDTELEYYILGSWNKGKCLKHNGLMKKTISMAIEKTTYHLISYYYPSDVRSGLLQTPSSMPHLASLEISPAVIQTAALSRQAPSAGKRKKGRPLRSRNAGYDLTDRSLRIPSAPLPYLPFSWRGYSPTIPSGMIAPPSWPAARSAYRICYTDSTSNSPSSRCDTLNYTYAHDKLTGSPHSPGIHDHASGAAADHRPNVPAATWYNYTVVASPSPSPSHPLCDHDDFTTSALYRGTPTSHAVAREHAAAPSESYAPQHLIRSWQPVLNEASMMSSSSVPSTRVTSSSQDVPPPSVPAHVHSAGPVYY